MILIMPGVVSSIFWIDGLYLTIRSVRQFLLQRKFADEGKTTTATITQVMEGSRYSPTTVHYSFVIDGQEQNGKHEFPKNFRGVRQGDEVSLVYLEENPKKRQLQVSSFNYSTFHMRFIVMGIVTIIIGCVAFWNLASPYFD